MSNIKPVDSVFGYQSFNNLLDHYFRSTPMGVPASGNESYLFTGATGIRFISFFNNVAFRNVTLPINVTDLILKLLNGHKLNNTGTSLVGLGFDVSDNAQQSEGMTVTKLLTSIQSIVSGYTNTITDDSVKTFAIPSYCFIQILSQSTTSNTRSARVINAGTSGLFAGDYLGTSCTIYATAGTLAGTTGTDGKLNFRANDTTLYVENRLGGNVATISITIIGGN